MTTHSIAEYRAKYAKPKRSKYGNKRTMTADGKSHASGREAKRWVQLCIMEQQGLITELERQVPFKFIINGKILLSDANRAFKYIADFRYRDGAGEIVVEDSKGFRTDIFKLKKGLMKVCHGISVREV